MRLWFNLRYLCVKVLCRVSRKHQNADLDFLIREIKKPK